MESVKEKAKKWCSEHSNKGCTEQCDGCWQLKQAWGCEQHNMETAYEAGANYVLDLLIAEGGKILMDTNGDTKMLLLKDLCARLPYKVMIQSVGENKCLGLMDLVDIDLLPKPYLRPMSSMTDEEILELKWLDEKCNAMPTFEYVSVENYRIFDWLNRHHFDYRGLIPMGLALEAPSGMYKKGE